MLNQCVIVGRLVGLYPEHGIIEVKVPRQKEGEDIITCKVEKNILSNVQEYCHLQDIVGIKGRIVTEGTNTMISTEKVTFLSSRNAEGGEEENGSNE